MNFRKLILIPCTLLFMAGSFFSCGVDRWPEYAPLTALDTWIHDIMQENYLWYEELPAYDDLNLFLDPEAFLSKVRAREDSYSFADSILDQPLPTYGFDYSLVRSVTNDTAYNALITYIIPNSPAYKAGLKRGEWIMQVNGQYISRKYEEKLLQGTDPVTLTLGAYEKVEPQPGEETPDEGEEEEDIYDVVPVKENIPLGAAQPLIDNPIHDYEILTLSDGASVGYLMYNSFTAGTKEDPEKYNNELRKISRKFSEASIQALILDLRYNQGGTIDCAQLLATLLAPAFYLEQTMAFLEYNNKNIDRNQTLTFDSKLLKDGVNLDLRTIIFLTSNETAGASEMLLTSLNYKTQQLITIGGNTKGQSVATEPFVNEEYRWVVNPVVCRIYDSEHVSPAGGYKATYSVSESSNYFRFLPFGDPEELLLNTAIGVLEGTYPPKDDTEEGGEEQTNTRLQPTKSVSSSASRKFVGGLRLR